MIPERVEIFMQVMIALICFPVIVILLRMIVKKVYLDRAAKQPPKFEQEAKAIILAIELTGLYLNHQAQVKLIIQVLPERGRNFVTEIKEVFAVKELAAIQAGDIMKVKYNPANTKETALVKAA